MRSLAWLGLLGGLASAHASLAADAPAQVQKAGAISVSAGWSRATFGPGATGIAFLTIDNAGAADALTGANCEGAKASSLHDEKNGTMAMPGMAAMRTDSMPLLDQIPVPAHGRVVLKPGGLHIMLHDMSTALVAGQSESCVLHFRTAGTLSIVLKIGRAGASTPPQ